MRYKLTFVPIMLVLLAAGAQATPILDGDLDGTPDAIDNCLGIDNPDQRDTDGDGYGNWCDPDLNNDGTINFVDLGMLKSRFFSSDANADLNGDGNVNFVDLGIMRSMFFGTPGPQGSGLGLQAAVDVPEPHMLALLGLGLFFAGMARRRV